MFFRKWRQLRRPTNILRPNTGCDALGPLAKSDPLTPDRAKLGEVELVCIVARVQNFESIVARLDLRELGGEMIKFYAAVAEAIMTEDGDINEFCGGTVVGHFNVLHKVEEARIVRSAMDVSRLARCLRPEAERANRRRNLPRSCDCGNVRLDESDHPYRIWAKCYLRGAFGQEERIGQHLRGIRTTFFVAGDSQRAGDIDPIALENRGLKRSVEIFLRHHLRGGLARSRFFLRRGIDGFPAHRFPPADCHLTFRRTG